MRRRKTLGVNKSLYRDAFGSDPNNDVVMQVMERDSYVALMNFLSICSVCHPTQLVERMAHQC